MSRHDTKEPDRPERFSQPDAGEKLTLTDAEWRARLTPTEFAVLRQCGTERAFTGHYYDHHADGVPTAARAAVRRSSARRTSSTRAPAGPATRAPSKKDAWPSAATRATA
jgi:hypothetical protein